MAASTPHVCSAGIHSLIAARPIDMLKCKNGYILACTVQYSCWTDQVYYKARIIYKGITVSFNASRTTFVVIPCFCVYFYRY